MKTVRLSLRAARALSDGLCSECEPALDSSLRELRAAIARLDSTKKVATRRMKRLKKSATKLEKQVARADVRDAVMDRAEGRCEACACGFAGPKGPGEMDHFFGKARAESVETCWALCRMCHRDKTNNEPSARDWALYFISHLEQHNYDTSRARRHLAWVTARAELSGKELAS